MNFLTIFVIFLIYNLVLINASEESSPGTPVLYFGFGSNLWDKRLLLNNPTAVRKGSGKLKDYRLDFSYYSSKWGGGAATIVPDEGSNVWGAIWEFDSSNLESLDKQELVPQKIYRPINVTIETSSGDEMICRAYQIIKSVPKLSKDEVFPADRVPSCTYLQTIIEGAIQTKLPNEYVEYLRSIKHNGIKAIPKFVEELKLQDENFCA